MGENDDPSTAEFPTVTRNIFGIGPIQCKELPVSRGKGIFTKSGGIHGIANKGDTPLRFVAFGYQTSTVFGQDGIISNYSNRRWYFTLYYAC